MCALYISFESSDTTKYVVSGVRSMFPLNCLLAEYVLRLPFFEILLLLLLWKGPAADATNTLKAYFATLW
jgi:hypothetical protein